MTAALISFPPRFRGTGNQPPDRRTCRLFHIGAGFLTGPLLSFKIKYQGIFKQFFKTPSVESWFGLEDLSY